MHWSHFHVMWYDFTFRWCGKRFDRSMIWEQVLLFGTLKPQFVKTTEFARSARFYLRCKEVTSMINLHRCREDKNNWLFTRLFSTYFSFFPHLLTSSLTCVSPCPSMCVWKSAARTSHYARTKTLLNWRFRVYFQANKKANHATSLATTLYAFILWYFQRKIYELSRKQNRNKEKLKRMNDETHWVNVTFSPILNTRLSVAHHLRTYGGSVERVSPFCCSFLLISK